MAFALPAPVLRGGLLSTDVYELTMAQAYLRAGLHEREVRFEHFFRENPDAQKPELQTRLGVYEEGCGLRNVDISWGHDEFLYHVTKDYLPEPAQYMIRYHSCYPIHREGAYDYLLDDHDREMMEWVRKFNPYDLYSKSDAPPDPVTLRPYYEDLINEFFPAKLRF